MKMSYLKDVTAVFGPVVLLFVITFFSDSYGNDLVSDTKVSLQYAQAPEGVFRMIQPRPVGEAQGKSDTVIVAFSYDDTPSLMEVGLYSFSNKTLKCLTCGLTIDGKAHNTFERPIPMTNNRIVVQTQMNEAKKGNEALFAFQVIECSPSIMNCTQVQLKSIRGTRSDGDITQRFHLPSPDGKKLVWEALRAVGGVLKLGSVVMMIGDLKNTDDGHYSVENVKVINPPFPNNKLPNSPEALAIRGTYFEPKDFCNGGKTLFFNSSYYRASDIDNFILDLETGAVTRVTTSAGWDEGGSCSPNNKMLVQAVQRGMRDAAALSIITRPPFLESPQALGNMKNYYVVGEDGTAWPRKGGRRSVVLFPISGESTVQNEVQLSQGESENWFVGPGEPVFFSDNKRMSWTETKYMSSETRIVLATIQTPLSNFPNIPYQSRSTASWAMSLKDYPNSHTHPVNVIYDRRGGSAVVSENFSLKGDIVVTNILYKNFRWKDSILNGSEQVTLIKKEAESEFGLPFYMKAQTDVNSSGVINGSMKMMANIFEGCAENLIPFSCQVNGQSYYTAWPTLGTDCITDQPESSK